MTDITTDELDHDAWEDPDPDDYDDAREGPDPDDYDDAWNAGMTDNQIDALWAELRLREATERLAVAVELRDRGVRLERIYAFIADTQLAEGPVFFYLGLLSLLESSDDMTEAEAYDAARRLHAGEIDGYRYDAARRAGHTHTEALTIDSAY